MMNGEEEGDTLWDFPEGVIDLNLSVMLVHLRFVFHRVVDFDQYPLITLRGLVTTQGANDSGLRSVVIHADSDIVPFQFDCEPGKGNGQVLTVTLKLFGDAREHLPSIINVIENTGMRNGFGGKLYHLESGPPHILEPLPWQPEWTLSGANTWRVRFVTPTKLFGSKACDYNDDILGIGLAKAAAKRLSALVDPHSDLERILTEKAAIDGEGAKVTRHSLTEVRHRRNSMSGGYRDYSGSVGWYELHGKPGLERWLVVGELLGVGKGVSPGRGRIRLEWL